MIDSLWNAINWPVMAGFAFVVGLFIGFFTGRSSNAPAKKSKKSKQQMMPTPDALDQIDQGAFANHSLQHEHNTKESDDHSSRSDIDLKVIRPVQEQQVDPDAERMLNAEAVSKKDRMVEEVQPVQATSASQGFGNEFLSSPNEHGEFDDTTRHATFRPDQSIYTIEFTNDMKTSAKYMIVEGPDAFELAMRRREAVLDPVADMTNAYRREAQSIVNEEAGEIELQQGLWKIRRKMKARYQ